MIPLRVLFRHKDWHHRLLTIYLKEQQIFIIRRLDLILHLLQNLQQIFRKVQTYTLQMKELMIEFLI